MKIVHEEIVDALMGLECIEFERCSFQVGEDMGAHWCWCLSLGARDYLVARFSSQGICPLALSNNRSLFGAAVSF